MVPPRRRAGVCRGDLTFEATARLMIARASQSAAIAHINQSKLARQSCARSWIARGNEPQGVQRRACGCSVKPLSTLIYCLAASRSVACVWRLCVRRCASALELGQIDLFSPSERIDIARKNELLWSAWYHNCWRHTNNRRNHLFQPIAARLQRRRWNMRMTVLGPAFGPFFFELFESVYRRVNVTTLANVAMLSAKCADRKLGIQSLFARGKGDNLSTEAAAAVQMRRLFGW